LNNITDINNNSKSEENENNDDDIEKIVHILSNLETEYIKR
jgi:hypothetical protein